MKSLPALARLDPRRSVAARLLLAFFVTSVVPGAVFVIVLERRLTDLQEMSVGRLTAVKVAEAGIRNQQDAAHRAEIVDKRVKTAEEAGWAVADQVHVLLTEPGVSGRPLPPPDEHGHVWNRRPEDDTVGILTRGHAARRSSTPRELSRTGPSTALLGSRRPGRPPAMRPCGCRRSSARA